MATGRAVGRGAHGILKAVQKIRIQCPRRIPCATLRTVSNALPSSQQVVMATSVVRQQLLGEAGV